MDFSYVRDWLDLLIRWAHLVFGAAWIGTSFYFNWLNNHLRPPREAEDGVGGELWSVHGGYFYRVLKYQVAPERLPDTLHWFKWEAYLTWITGVCLLGAVYYFGADIYMVDSSVADISPRVAVAIGIGTLVGGWLLYHFACKSPLGRRPVAFAAVMFAAAVAVAYGLTEVLSPRAAYIHVGALLGTCMALNVFFVIIPNQRVMVNQLMAGREPDPRKGRDGAQRSLHNNYMTLPVLFIMISNHFPMTYGARWNWAILAGLSIIGAATRHWFNLKGRGHYNAWILPAAAAATLALAFVMSPYARTLARDEAPGDEAEVSYAEVEGIIANRCMPCHQQQPSFAGIVEPPLGLLLETPEQIQAAAKKIRTTSVDTQTMPLGNLTKMTDEERRILGAWIRQGARID